MPDLAALEAAFSDRTKVVLLNNPHNPTGAVFPREVLQRVVDLARTSTTPDHHRRGLRAPHLRRPRTSRWPRCPVRPNRTITISSAGKTFSFTGWKIGWLTGPEDLVAAVRTVKQFLTYSSGTPFQSAIAAGLGLPDEFYARHRGHPARASATSSARGCAPPASTSSPRRAPTSSTWTRPRWASRDSVDLARRLPELVGVAAIPVPVFCHPEGAERTRSLLRFAFCKKTDVLEEAAERLATLRDRL